MHWTAAHAKQLTAQLAKGRVAVIGDLMVDLYVHGEVQRISPEAPVPVLRVTHERRVLGAAANVAANITALGGAVDLVGYIGEDVAGRELCELLSGFAGVTPWLVSCHCHPTIIKTRYLGARQQIVRVDRESSEPYPSTAQDRLIAAIAGAVEASDVVVLSDYGKGALTDAVLAKALRVAAAAGKPVIVDPKRSDFSAYRGATYITPNRKELEAAVGAAADSDAQAQAAAQMAIEASGSAILMTRSEKGMSLFRAGAAPVHMSTQAREVFDVSGAGDTVVATMALGLASGMDVETAMSIANSAAGVVVAKVGTATCRPDELEGALARQAGREPEPARAATEATGAVSWDEAALLRAQWRDEGLSVGFANGCFDLIHPGHVTLLRKAASLVDRLIVAINSDASVSALKGPTRPVQTQEDRAVVLLGIKGVAMVTVFGEPTPRELIEKLVPDVLIKGADYREEDVVGGDIVKAAGGRVALIDLVEGQSTSALVRRANQGPD